MSKQATTQSIANEPDPTTKHTRSRRQADAAALRGAGLSHAGRVAPTFEGVLDEEVRARISPSEFLLVALSSASLSSPHPKFARAFARPHAGTRRRSCPRVLTRAGDRPRARNRARNRARETCARNRARETCAIFRGPARATIRPATPGRIRAGPTCRPARAVPTRAAMWPQCLKIAKFYGFREAVVMFAFSFVFLK